MDMPKNNIAASNRSCNTPVRPISTRSSRCNIYDETRQTEYHIHVWEGRVDKSLHRNYRQPSRACAIMSHTEGLCKARKFPSGCWPCMYGCRYFSIATQPADYHDYLIYKLCVYYFFKFRDAPIVIKWYQYIHSMTASDLRTHHKSVIITVIMEIRTWDAVHK